MSVDVLDRPERPESTYDQARARFEALLRADTDAVDPRSRSRLESPGWRTRRATESLHLVGSAVQAEAAWPRVCLSPLLDPRAGRGAAAGNGAHGVGAPGAAPSRRGMDRLKRGGYGGQQRGERRAGQALARG